MNSLFSRQSTYVFFAIFCSFGLAIFSEASYFQPGNIGVDDANIFFVFARNFVAGHGLVWNPGEAPVEGFTSILWQIVCITFFFFTNDPSNLLLILSLIVFSLAATYFISSLFSVVEIDNQEKANLLKTIFSASFIFWCFSSPGFLTWNFISLMDTGLWTASTMLVAASYLSSNTRIFILSLVALCFVRPEGFAVSFAAFSIHAFDELRRDNSKKSLLCILKYFSFLLASVVILTLFRLAYFSYPLPNTYYAKVGNNQLEQLRQGSLYFYDFICSTNGLAGVLALLAIFPVARFIYSLFFKDNTKLIALNKFALCGSIFLLGFLIYIYVGGDHFPLHRQYQGFWPLGFAVLACLILLFPGKTFPYFAILGTTAIFAYISIQSPQIPSMRFQYMLSHLGRAAGEKLNELFPEQDKPRVSAIAVGGIAYTYKGKLIDLMGITNTEMAHATRERKGEKNHAAFDIPTFYKISPDMIVHFGPSCLLRKGFENDDFINKVLKNLPQDPHFRSQYQLMRVPGKLDSKLPGGICGFVSRSYADRIERVDGMYVYDWKAAIRTQ